MSMMVHEVRVMQGKTFRFNLSVCTPYNADFDGDEMNLHIIQSEEARAEAKVLMRVQENILSPRYGGAVIGGIHDHISGAYLLTNGDPVIPKSQSLEILSKINWTGELPKEVKDENGEIGYNGRELLNLIIPPGINLSYKSRSNDQVEVIDGEILSGTIDKTGIGAEDGKLLDAVLQIHGNTRGAQFLNELTQLTIGMCTALGFTTGIDDEDLPPAARTEISEINSTACADVDDKLELYGKNGRGYEARPGRTPLETLEEDIMQILDKSRSRTGEIAKEHLASDNAAVMMAVSGARGSMDNLSMMAGSIGQTRVRGQRLERGYKDRVLSHFERNAKGAREKGFVQSSFKKGLEPTEFFMLSVSGRESLVDTAVRTSKSGYMQRRLINAMDDLKVHGDVHRSVRNTADRIIQFSYGEDGTDPTRSIRGSAINIRDVLDNALGGEK
jgi:DNA-directed RNA polymerase subunit A'